jgi:hypothetical protein
MKILKYSICRKVNNGTEEEPQIKDVLFPVEMGWNEANEEIAKREAYKGEYTIEDDGQPVPAETPTQLDRIEAQVTYTAMITDTLLPEV